MKLEVLHLTDPRELRKYLPAWDDLAGNAAEPNAFYESWMLLPALERLQDSSKVEFLLVVERPVSSTLASETRLCGLFPLEVRRTYKKFPFPHYRLWQHRHCYLCTPLIRESHLTATLDAFTGWLGSKKSAAISNLFSWNSIGMDGPIYAALRALAKEEAWLTNEDSHDRAVLVRSGDPDVLIKSVISAKHLKEYSRLERRLSERGLIEYSRLGPGAPFALVVEWIENFLCLEESGWKGQSGTALNSNSADREFFRSAAVEAFRQGKLSMYSYRVDGKSIASVCEFLSGNTGFSFKAAYAEEFARYRPTTLLQLRHIRELASYPAGLIDSCADQGNPVVDRLWTSRRKVGTFTVSMGSFPVGMMVELGRTASLIKRKITEFKIPEISHARKQASRYPTGFA